MRRIDMHIHTNASDGSFTAVQAAGDAAAKELNFVCLCDHDTMANSESFIKEASARGIASLPSAELTSVYNDLEFHILGYGLDENSAVLRKAFEYTDKVRRERDIELIDAMQKRGMKVSLEDFLVYKQPEDAGGFPALNYLKSQNIVGTVKEYLAMKSSMRLEPYRYLSAEETIKTIKDAGGLVVLAHPSYHFRGSVADAETLDAMREMGIEGIECFSPYNSLPEQNDYYMEYCEQYGLAVSGGSDCHGPYLDRPMGKPSVNDEICDILERLGV